MKKTDILYIRNNYYVIKQDTINGKAAMDCEIKREKFLLAVSTPFAKFRASKNLYSKTHPHLQHM